jgi:HEAT repeat protein
MPLVRKPRGTGAGTPSAPDAASVRAALAAGTDEERWAAARAAGELPELVDACAQALRRETNARVREAIFTSLAKIKTRESVAAVLPFLRSDDASMRTAAAGSLHAMQHVAWPSVAPLLHDASPHVRICGCEFVRSMPKEDAVALICELLDAEDEPNVCAAAVESLAEIGGAEALPALTRCAERFRENSFLQFSISVAIDRIRAQDPTLRG